MNWILYLAAIAAGAFSTALSGSNATMNKTLAQPVIAGLIIQVVTIAVIFAAAPLLGGFKLPETGRFAQLPWWAWLGGFGGAAVLFAQLMVAQQIGAAPFLAVTVTAGIVVSVALDHFALLGFERNPAQIGRLIGAALMVGGVVLVARN